MSCSKFSHADDDKYSDGVSFLFKFSMGANLALSAVDIKNGIPRLHFKPAQNVPVLTEEDVAVIVKLCLENKRPGFFYEGFHPLHPFSKMGRLFKGYSPRWLRGTSVGELLAEADWSMKCIHVGVKSDKKKKNFSARSQSSNLRGLRTREDFPEDCPGATIIMRCECVDVDERNDELYFVAEPKMRIDCVRDGHNLEYSKYITEIFDSVAYHDEPKFMKIKEIIKLVLAVEWLKEKLDEKNMRFSQVWIDEHLQKRKQHPTERIQVTVPPQEAQRLMNDIVEAKNDKQLALHNSSGLRKKVSETGIEVATTTNVLGCDIPVVCRASFNDYDFLFEGQDPNQPTDLGLDEDTGRLVVGPRPNVNSWTELYSQTVPQPCTVSYTADGPIGPAITGGVSTSSFKTKQVRREHTTQTKDKIVVPAGHKLKMSYADTPKEKTTNAPTSDVGVTTPNSELRSGMREAGVKYGAGIIDCTSYLFSSENGGQTLAKGKKVEIHVSAGSELCPPPKPEASGNCDSEYSSIASTAMSGSPEPSIAATDKDDSSSDSGVSTATNDTLCSGTTLGDMDIASTPMSGSRELSIAATDKDDSSSDSTATNDTLCSGTTLGDIASTAMSGSPEPSIAATDKDDSSSDSGVSTATNDTLCSGTTLGDMDIASTPISGSRELSIAATDKDDSSSDSGVSIATNDTLCSGTTLGDMDIASTPLMSGSHEPATDKDDSSSISSDSGVSTASNDTLCSSGSDTTLGDDMDMEVDMEDMHV